MDLSRKDGTLMKANFNKFPMRAHIYILAIQIIYIFYMLINEYSIKLAKIYIDSQLSLNILALFWVKIVLFLMQTGGKVYFALPVLFIITMVILENKYSIKGDNRFYNIIAATNLVILFFVFIISISVVIPIDQFWSGMK